MYVHANAILGCSEVWLRGLREHPWYGWSMRTALRWTKFCSLFLGFLGRAKLVGSLSTVLASFSAHETIRHTSAALPRGAKDQGRQVRNVDTIKAIYFKDIVVGEDRAKQQKNTYGLFTACMHMPWMQGHPARCICRVARCLQKKEQHKSARERGVLHQCAM